jgi:hypothetical protein
MVRRNKPNVPAHALGHIQSSRSDARWTRPHQIADEDLDFKPTDNAAPRSTYQSTVASPPASVVSPDDEFLSEFLSIYHEVEHPSINLLATIHLSIS